MKTTVLILAILFSGQAIALQLNGYTDFSQRLGLNLGVSGYVAGIAVRSGQLVKQGELLLSLDERHFEAALERARAKVKTHTPARSQMLIELEKAQELYDRDSLALVELQQAENNLQLAEGQLDMARADLHEAELELRQSSLLATIDGLVLQVHTHKSRYINTQVTDQTLVTLVDNQSMLAIASLTPEQWNLALVGKPASIVFHAKTYTGEVVNLSNDLVQQSSGQRLYELQVLFVASGEIPANMPVTIEIQE